MHPGPGHRGGTLVSGLLHHFGKLSAVGGVDRPGIIHRLDKETSGCLVVAKTDAAHRALAAQFASREVVKVYLAVLRVRRDFVPALSMRRSHAIRASQEDESQSSGRGREAITEYRVIATAEAKACRMPSAHWAHASDSGAPEASGLPGARRSTLRSARQLFASYAARVEAPISPPALWHDLAFEAAPPGISNRLNRRGVPISRFS